MPCHGAVLPLLPVVLPYGIFLVGLQAVAGQLPQADPGYWQVKGARPLNFYGGPAEAKFSSAIAAVPEAHSGRNFQQLPYGLPVMGSEADLLLRSYGIISDGANAPQLPRAQGAQATSAGASAGLRWQDWQAPSVGAGAGAGSALQDWQASSTLLGARSGGSSGHAFPGALAYYGFAQTAAGQPQAWPWSWRQLQAPAVTPAPMPPVSLVNPLTPLYMQRAPRRDTIVQVDGVLCNPPCEFGRGVCARDVSGGAHALDGGAPRCFCRSPYNGPSCGGLEATATGWAGQLAFLESELSTVFPESLAHSTGTQVAMLCLSAATLAVLAMLLCRCGASCKRGQERGPKGAPMSAENAAAAMQRDDSAADRASLARGLPLRGSWRSAAGEERPRACGDGFVEAWVKAQLRRTGSVGGRRRPGLDSVPQVFKDESDEED